MRAGGIATSQLVQVSAAPRALPPAAPAPRAITATNTANTNTNDDDDHDDDDQEDDDENNDENITLPIGEQEISPLCSSEHRLCECTSRGSATP